MTNVPRTLSHGPGVTMVLDPRRVLISFASAHDPEDLERRAKQLGLEIEDAGEELDFLWAMSPGDEFQPRPAMRPGVGGDRARLFCARSTSGAIDEQRFAGIARELEQAMPDVESVDLVYMPMGEPRALEAQTPLGPHPPYGPGTPFDDPLYPEQWNLQRIHAPEAWAWSQGRGTIVAVIDCGCETAHPDLRFVGGFNWKTRTFDGDPTTPFPAPPPPEGFDRALFDRINLGHGTNVAGIIGARRRNGIGLIGVAPQCRIMPLALHTWSANEMAEAISFAASHGANVINICYGQYGDGTDTSWPPVWGDAGEQAIGQAIDEAWRRGCIVVAAAGNDERSDHNYFPARHERVIACGASNDLDQRKPKADPRPNWLPGGWGSNYGPGLSLVAPGVEIRTTDLLGESNGLSALDQAYSMDLAGSYDGGNYIRRFFATSSATPHVSGVAAAVQGYALTCDESLSPREVRFVLEWSADKLPDYQFTQQAGYRHGPRNAEVGYGRLNMLKALVLTGELIALKQWWRRMHHLLERAYRPPLPPEPPVQIEQSMMELAEIAQASELGLLRREAEVGTGVR